MAQRKIQPVTDNRDKQRTYQEQMKKYKLALKHEFYFEAIMIDYAVLEDRLHSMIHYLGFLDDRSAVNISRKRRPALVEMVTACMGEKEAKKLGLGNISGKLKIIRSVLCWADGAQTLEDAFLQTLKSSCDCLDRGAMTALLDGIVAWCDYRNEIVHAMMNKNMDSMTVHLKARAEEGMALARGLDAQVRLLKKKNTPAPAEGKENDHGH